MNISDILSITSLKKEEIVSIFPYGSRVYQTNDENSDFDFVVVAKDGEKREVKTDTINVTIYSEKMFEKLIKEQEISALECIFLKKEQIIYSSREYLFEKDLSTLRASISKKASNSWVKAKKKLVVKEDFDVYVAKKSLFHSFRILDFGIQIATKGRIINYDSMNDLWREIKNSESVEWSYYQEKYQKKHNELKSTFKTVAPK